MKPEERCTQTPSSASSLLPDPPSVSGEAFVSYSCHLLVDMSDNSQSSSIVLPVGKGHCSLKALVIGPLFVMCVTVDGTKHVGTGQRMTKRGGHGGGANNSKDAKAQV